MTSESAIDAFVREFKEAMESGDMQRATDVLAANASEEFVVEWPQSGERIRGIENYRRINEQYGAATGTSPRVTFRRVRRCGDTIIGEGTIDYGDGTPVSLVSLTEWADGKIVRETEYFANPFEAPEWRRPYVERMD